MKDRSYNIIIAGVGGQGVVTLTRIFWQWCKDNNIQLLSSIFKGGAQTLGPVHSELKIAFKKIPNFEYFSPQIKEGELDLIVGLEVFETLRYFKFFSSETRMVVNSYQAPFWIDRVKSNPIENPLDIINDHPGKKLIMDATSVAIKNHNSTKMMNVELLLAGIEDGLIPIDYNLTTYSQSTSQ